MKLLQWLVILGGLLGGYWLVSRLMGDGAGPPPRDRTRPPPRPEPDGHEPREGNTHRTHDTPPSPPGLTPWHEVLEVAPNAPMSEIKAAYRRKMSQYHPDKVVNLGPEIRATAETMSRRINDAYERAMGER